VPPEATRAPEGASPEDQSPAAGPIDISALILPSAPGEADLPKYAVLLHRPDGGHDSVFLTLRGARRALAGKNERERSGETFVYLMRLIPVTGDPIGDVL